MPYVPLKTDLFPEDLLDRDGVGEEPDVSWWALYTLSRREKDLMHRMVPLKIPFYGPFYSKRTATPQGRIHTAHLPMFSNYVFMYGTLEQRRDVMKTNCVSHWVDVHDGAQLTADLRRVRKVILAGLPITIEERLGPGDYVRIKKGALQGCEGRVVERRGSRRLFVDVNLIQRSISVQLDDCVLEPAVPRDFSLELRDPGSIGFPGTIAAK